jgi:UDP-glucose-4-epimerase GalE
MPNRVLVVGGAGYIGSVCAAHLVTHGYEVEVYDDLSTGHREAVSTPLHVGDIRDRGRLAEVLAAGRFDAVMHFAAKSLVGESVSHPLRYFDVNVGGTATLVQAMLDAGVRSLVFSSTCAVYGVPDSLPIPEDHPHRPVSPYGESKAMVEQLLAACREREGLRVTSLRYFNAAGATLDARLGEAHSPETHLIPLALQAAMGLRPPLKLFGTDYETRDGTCIRDYIHVLDLAEVHRLAIAELIAGDRGGSFNLGTGVGTTVREVIASIERITGMTVPHSEAARREGDPPALYAAADTVRARFGWTPKHAHIDDIVRTAAAWAKAPRY